MTKSTCVGVRLFGSESGDLRSEARHKRISSVPKRSVRKTVCAKSLPEFPAAGSEGSDDNVVLISGDIAEVGTGLAEGEI